LQVLALLVQSASKGYQDTDPVVDDSGGGSGSGAGSSVSSGGSSGGNTLVHELARMGADNLLRDWLAKRPDTDILRLANHQGYSPLDVSMVGEAQTVLLCHIIKKVCLQAARTTAAIDSSPPAPPHCCSC